MNDNWSAVPGIVGFLGRDITTATGVDPQTLLTDSTVANDMNVIANQVETSVTNGGVGEFQGNAMFPFPNPVVGLQANGTADAPHIVLNLDTTDRIECLRRLQPARHRRHRRQRRAAGRAPISRRCERPLDERPGRIRRGCHDGSEPCDAGHARERRPSLGGRMTSRWSRSGSSRPTPSRPTNGSASTTSPSRRLAIDQRARRPVDVARRWRDRRRASTRTSRSTFSEPVNVTGSSFDDQCATPRASTPRPSPARITVTVDPDAELRLQRSLHRDRRRRERERPGHATIRPT